MKRTTIWAGLLVAILLAAVVLAPAQGDTRWLRTLHNTAHGPVFGCVALLVLWGLRADARVRGWSVLRQYAWALAAAAMLGVLTEIMQIPVGRDASVLDALNDVLGAVTFLAGYSLIDPQVRVGRGARALAVGVTVAGLVALALPISHATYKYYQRELRFPVLADYTSAHDDYFLLPKSSHLSHVALPAPWARAGGESAMLVELQDGPYPGWELSEPRADWRHHQSLAVDMTNPDATPLVLTLRVHDARHDNRPQDRFSMRIELPAGAREVVRIPLQQISEGPQRRAMDLSAIAGLIAFASGQDMQGRRLYLSRIWLE